jgi:hypothetical protein
MVTANIDLEQKFTYTKDCLYNSGKAFQIQKRFTLTSGQTYYLAVDNTALTAAGKTYGSFPVVFASTAGLVLVDTYKSALSVNGTELTPMRINETLTTVVPLTKFYHGCTPVITAPTDAREYTIGTKATNQSSGAGNPTVDVVKILSTTTPSIIKLMNQETSVNIVTFSYVWFEI